MDRIRRITLDLDAFDLVVQTTVTLYSFGGERTAIHVVDHGDDRPTLEEALPSALTWCGTQRTLF